LYNQVKVRIFNDIADLREINSPVLTIGTFDGVHLGHQKIIQALNDEAERCGGESVLFTFYPHPRMVLYPDAHGLQLIDTQDEKIEKLQSCGLKNLIIVPFTFEFSRQTALEFVRDFLVNQLNIKTLVIGYDHQFGRNREGDIHFLRETAELYGFNVVEISALEIEQLNVSSTKIREALNTGKVDVARSYLGKPFTLTGKVTRGNQLGRTIGYPTANIQIEASEKIIPGNGVYATYVNCRGERYLGMTNIGVRPTVVDSGKKTVEVNIFDFAKDIYEEEIQLEFVSFVRNEQKFEGLDYLKAQLAADELHVRSVLQ
jgi:riboflavin kinase/FMN adenylyltransferase